jgi:acyl-CoA thioesterase I
MRRETDLIMALVTFRSLFPALFCALVFSSCGDSPRQEPGSAAAKAPVPASVPVLQPPPPTQDDGRPVIVAFGDSLSAGYGLEAGLSYPDFLQKILDAKGHRYRIVNQGISGDTTSGGLARIDHCIAQKPKIVLLELGGNDGLRGIPVGNIRTNLDRMIRQLKATGATVVLVGITLPPNYGDYVKGFENNYADLAREHSLTFIPFLMEGIWTPTGGKPGMMQEDGIHPTAKGTPVMAETVYQAIRKLL